MGLFNIFMERSLTYATQQAVEGYLKGQNI
jgi:hypothetical protein